MNLCLCRTYEFDGDGLSLLNIFRDQPYAFLLDSSLPVHLAGSQADHHRGRYSFVGFDPFYVHRSKSPDALESLREKFLQYPVSDLTMPTPFPAGLMGYLSYDYGLYQERIHLNASDDYKLPLCVFGFYDCVLTVDHFWGKIHITSTGWPETSWSLRQQRARQRIEFIEARLAGLKESTRPQEIIPVEQENFMKGPVSNFTKAEYERMVIRALDYIDRGDIYQVNLSQRFEMDHAGRGFDPLETYSLLRKLSPSHYAAYFDASDHLIISSSPEQFLHKEGRRVLTRPMKGTRTRAAMPEKDRSLRDEIMNSAKEKAELLMVTDLERNDLGKVCEYGSIKVSEMRALEEYKTVFQTTSTVEGILRNDKDAFDLIKACFPSGSVTGCPKIRAMELIEELEPTRRGPYTGSLGYISFSGNMNLNVLIRTLLSYNNKIYYQAGGGIVADSVAEKEYEETLVKAQAIRLCLEKVFQADSAVVNK